MSVSSSQAEALLRIVQAGTTEACRELAPEEAEARGWAGMQALRELGEAGEVVTLLAAVRQIAPQDPMVEGALWQLRRIGPPVVEPALALLEAPPNLQVRDHLAEALTAIFADWSDDGLARRLQTVLAEIFHAAAEHGERELYAELLGDLLVPGCLELLVGAARNPQMTPEEYEALRDAIERLGGECPETYFDEGGQAWGVDDQGVVQCLYCGRRADPQPDGGIRHAGEAAECPLEEQAT